MRECKKVKKMLSRYLDKETDNSDTSMIKAHLDICPVCMEDYSALLKGRDFVAGIDRKTLPQDYLISRLHEKIADERRARERPSLAGMGIFARRLIPIPVAAIIASLIFLILTYTQPAAEYTLDDHILSGSAVTTETALGLILGSQN